MMLGEALRRSAEFLERKGVDSPRLDAERQREEQRKEMEALSGDKREVAFGSQIRTYTLAPYQLVKDERTRFETGNVQSVLDGDLDGFIEAYLQWRRGSARPLGNTDDGN